MSWSEVNLAGQASGQRRCPGHPRVLCLVQVLKGSGNVRSEAQVSGLLQAEGSEGGRTGSRGSEGGRVGGSGGVRGGSEAGLLASECPSSPPSLENPPRLWGSPSTSVASTFTQLET